MKDTSDSILSRYRRLLLERTGSERLIMGFEMFEASRAIMKAGITAKNDSELRIQLLKRLYMRDLDPLIMESVIERMKTMTDGSG